MPGHPPAGPSADDRDASPSRATVRTSPIIRRPSPSIDQIERGLQGLTIDQRTVLVLTYYLDLPIAEGASVLGIPTGTMKSRLHRASRRCAPRSMRTNDRCPRPRSERHDRPSRRRAVPPRPFRSDGRYDRPRRSDRCRPQRDRRSAAAARVAGGAQEPPDDHYRTVVRTTAFDARVGVLLIILALLIAITRGRRDDGNVPAPAGTDRERTDRVRTVRRDRRGHGCVPGPSGRLRRTSRSPSAVECPQLLADGAGSRRIRRRERRRDGSARCSRASSRAPHSAARYWSPDGRRLAIEGFNDADRTVNGIYLADAADGGNVVRLTTERSGRQRHPRRLVTRRQAHRLQPGSPGTDRMWAVDVDVERLGDAYEVTRTWLRDSAGHLTASGCHRLRVGQVDFIMVRPDGVRIRAVMVPARDAQWAGEPTFSPDGTRLASSTWRSARRTMPTSTP